MNSRTKKFLIVLSIILLLLIVTFVITFIQLLSSGDKLTGEIETLKERNSKEASFNRINALVQETVDERGEIDALFFADESDSITFLNEIEKLAKENNLNLETKSLATVLAEDNGTELVKIDFSFSGTRTQIDAFTTLLENIPYHSMLDTLSLRNNQGDNWTGAVTLLVTIQPRL